MICPLAALLWKPDNLALVIDINKYKQIYIFYVLFMFHTSPLV